MPRRKASKKSNFIKIAVNLSIISMMLVVFGFLVSVVDSMFFDDGKQLDRPNLEKLLTKTSYEKDTGHKITIEIHNGCGIAGLANLYTEFLRSEGFDVLDSRNADHFGYTHSTILHHNGDKARAVALGETMSIPMEKIIESKDKSILHDLTLILGEDYNTLNSYATAVSFKAPF